MLKNTLARDAMNLPQTRSLIITLKKNRENLKKDAGALKKTVIRYLRPKLRCIMSGIIR